MKQGQGQGTISTLLSKIDKLQKMLEDSATSPGEKANAQELIDKLSKKLFTSQEHDIYEYILELKRLEELIQSSQLVTEWSIEVCNRDEYFLLSAILLHSDVEIIYGGGSEHEGIIYNEEEAAEAAEEAEEAEELGGYGDDYEGADGYGDEDADGFVELIISEEGIQYPFSIHFKCDRESYDLIKARFTQGLIIKGGKL